MDDIATYSDALPAVPDQSTELEYPESTDMLTFSDDFFQKFADYDRYYISTQAEHQALKNIDYSDAQTALLKLEYVRTYETVKIKETLTGILVLIIFIGMCQFFRRWIGG